MVVQRHYMRLKRDADIEEVLKIAREVANLFAHPGKIRYYSANIGPPANTFVWEIEFENLAEQERFWAAWLETEEVPPLLEKWYKVVEEDIKSELWYLHE